MRRRAPGGASWRTIVSWRASLRSRSHTSDAALRWGKPPPASAHLSHDLSTAVASRSSISTK
eukprot:11189031-Lingulodinium_polyedra.AAC.1